MAGKSTAFIVFILPVILSLAFGSYVMADVLKEPGRQLDMWNFERHDGGGLHDTSDDSIEIRGLQKEYAVSMPIELQVSVTDEAFDCGDLYITVFEVSGTSREVITQSGYFTQCFSVNDLLLPVDDEFSEALDTPGEYEIVAEMHDAKQQKTIISKKLFTVG